LKRDEERTFIGWQGISVRVPSDWTLGAVGGDRKSGYLRVDDAYVPRLQVKWSSKHIDLERKRKEYVKRLTVGKRKRPTGLEVKTDIKVISKRGKPKKELLTYAWRGRQCGMGVLWNCEVCGRALIAQVSWRPEEEGRGLAQEVLQSLDDHGIGGWDTWAADGLVYLAPSEFGLEGWKRMTRYLEMRLERDGETLKVARWGMVPLVLGERTVREWFEDENRRRRDVRWRAEECEIKGHEGIMVRGEKRRLAGGVRKRAAEIVRRSPAVYFDARAWHCPVSNRLYLVENLHGREGEIVSGVLDSIICHEEQ